MNIGYGNEGNGYKPNVKFDDATVIVLKTAELVIQDPVSGVFYGIRVTNGNLSLVRVDQPPD